MATAAFDLSAYGDRVGLDGGVGVDPAGLARVQDAHLRSIAFENFDLLLGRGVSVEPAAVFDRLVTDRRGGYCFTTNPLLCGALRAMGFDARVRLGRVLFGPPGPTPPRLHALVLVELDGQTYLVDAGFGAHTPRGVMPLRDGAELRAVDRAWRLQADPEHGWRLLDRTAEGWRDLYLFDDTPVYEEDVDVANYWVSTCPQSPFVGAALIVRHTPTGRITLLDRVARRYVGTHCQTDQLKTPEQFRRFIHDELMLDVQADADAWQTLWQKVGGEPMQIDW